MKYILALVLAAIVPTFAHAAGGIFGRCNSCNVQRVVQVQQVVAVPTVAVVQPVRQVQFVQVQPAFVTQQVVVQQQQQQVFQVQRTRTVTRIR